MMNRYLLAVQTITEHMETCGTHAEAPLTLDVDTEETERDNTRSLLEGIKRN